MPSYHATTFQLIGIDPQVSPSAVARIEETEQRLGLQLPPAVREWYSIEAALDILARYSNQDWPIPLGKFAEKEWKNERLIPFKYENQGVCVWAILLDGSDDPAVYVDVDSDGAQWTMQAPSFSAYVYSCVWDYVYVFDQPALVQAQNDPLSPQAISKLTESFSEEPPTFGWPGNTQFRFAGEGHALLIWNGDEQADWFVGATDEHSLETALRMVWNLDHVGDAFYDCSALGKAVLTKIRGG